MIPDYKCSCRKIQFDPEHATLGSLNADMSRGCPFCKQEITFTWRGKQIYECNTCKYAWFFAADETFRYISYRNATMTMVPHDNPAITSQDPNTRWFAIGISGDPKPGIICSPLPVVDFQSLLNGTAVIARQSAARRKYRPEPLPKQSRTEFI